MDTKTTWSLAAKNGLIFSLISIIANLLTTTLELAMTMNILVVIVKFVLIIWLLYYYMKHYTEDVSGYVSYGTSFGYGFKLCLCSAFVCTVFAVLLYFVIAPDLLEKSLETALPMMQNSYPGIELDYDEIMKIAPTLVIVSEMLKCLFWGLVLPAIIANFTKNTDITEFPAE